MSSPEADILDDLRQMTGMDHVGRTAHRAAEEIERLRAEISSLRERVFDLEDQWRAQQYAE